MDAPIKMNNPYKKTEKSDYQAKYFHRNDDDRWAFFEASGGQIWASAERRKWRFQYARDYCHGVFVRWVRANKMYLPEVAQKRFLEKVIGRDNWFSRAHLQMVWQPKFWNQSYGQVSWVAFYRVSQKQGGTVREKLTCEYCGSKAVAHLGDGKEGQYSYFGSSREYPDDGDAREYTRYIPHCSNAKCREVFDFVSRKGAAIERAKIAGVKPNIPRAVGKWISGESEYLLAASALLDMEARVMLTEKKALQARGYE